MRDNWKCSAEAEPNLTAANHEQMIELLSSATIFQGGFICSKNKQMHLGGITKLPFSIFIFIVQVQ